MDTAILIIISLLLFHAALLHILLHDLVSHHIRLSQCFHFAIKFPAYIFQFVIVSVFKIAPVQYDTIDFRVISYCLKAQDHPNECKFWKHLLFVVHWLCEAHPVPKYRFCVRIVRDRNVKIHLCPVATSQDVEPFADVGLAD
jgi:hypothetical protein